MRRLFKISLAIAIVIATPVASAGVMLGAFLFLPLPAQLPEPQSPDPSRVTRVLDQDGNEIALFRTFETSIPVKAKDIPQIMKDAVVAAEDKNFYEHGGVDIRGTARALLADVRSGESVQGGSTITQQLVKNSYTLDKRKTLGRKIREAVVAAQLDRASEKDQILLQYLRVIYLGEGAYGVGAAAETYFRKSVKDLDLTEAALLAGLIPAPSRYSPRVNPELADEKRRIVLRTMLEEKMISQDQFDRAIQRTVWLKVNGKAPGPATIIYPPKVQTSSQPWFTDYVRRFLTKHLPGGEQQLNTGGLTVITTMQPKAQFLAQQAVNEALASAPADRVTPDGVKHVLQMSLVSVDPGTGYVRAMIGGRDFKTQKANLALGACPDPGQTDCLGGGGSGRSPGSTFKPFVLAEAFEQGITPNNVYSGATHYVSPDYTAHNYGGSSYGSLPLRNATWKSVNTVFTRLILDVGVENAFKRAKKLGLHIPKWNPRNYGPSVALGAVDVSPLDMASAYGTFAFGGLHQEPTPVAQVYDAEHNLILDFTDRERNPRTTATRVLREEVADNVTDVLQGVLTSGTAAGRGIDRPAAGKTGTSQENRDAWFVGYTPDVSTAVWIGFDPATSLTGIGGYSSLTGGSIPAKTWQSYMKALLEGVEITKFNEPAPIRGISEDARSRARRGFNVGITRYPAGGADGGPYTRELDPLVAPMPTTSTTQASTSTTSTSTTTPTSISLN